MFLQFKIDQTLIIILFLNSFLDVRSQPRGDDCARPWSPLSWQQREQHKTTRRYPPLRRWWTASPSSPSRQLASPRCSSVWQKYPHDISYCLRTNFVYTTRIFPPYALFVVRLFHYLSFRVGFEASEVEPWIECSCCEAGFWLCWSCPSSVCWFAFVYILTSVLWCHAHLSCWVLTYWIFEAPSWLWASAQTAFFGGSFALLCLPYFLPLTW